MSTLVVYYSRTGTTKKLAQILAEKINADLEEIKGQEDRSGLKGYLKSGKEAAKKELPNIQASKKKVENYDLVIIGTPVWVGTIASPVRTYIVNSLGNFNEVAFFTTQGSSKKQKVFKEMEKLMEKKSIAGLQLCTKDVMNDNFEEKLNAFVKKII